MLLFTARAGGEEGGRATLLSVNWEEEEKDDDDEKKEKREEIVLDGSEDNMDGLCELVSAKVPQRCSETQNYEIFPKSEF